MESGTALTVLVGVIALAMLAQSVAVLVLVGRLGKAVERIETMVSAVSQVARDAQPLLDSAREILTEGKERIKSVSSQIQSISADALEITGMVKGQARRMDDLLTEASERLRAQIVRLDDLVSDTVAKVEETGKTVQRAVLTPVREIAAVLSGIRAALDMLRRRESRTVDHAEQDEELFI